MGELNKKFNNYWLNKCFLDGCKSKGVEAAQNTTVLTKVEPPITNHYPIVIQ